MSSGRRVRSASAGVGCSAGRAPRRKMPTFTWRFRRSEGGARVRSRPRARSQVRMVRQASARKYGSTAPWKPNSTLLQVEARRRGGGNDRHIWVVACEAQRGAFRVAHHAVDDDRQVRVEALEGPHEDVGPGCGRGLRAPAATSSASSSEGSLVPAYARVFLREGDRAPQQQQLQQRAFMACSSARRLSPPSARSRRPARPSPDPWAATTSTRASSRRPPTPSRTAR